MAKEESGRLFSKVAKFVRNPLKDWSDLDAEDSASPENGYSREMLKEMIERRQRNDFVRRREFDMLRKLRQREAAGVQDGSATPSSFNVNSTSGKSEGRALTLKKIDEIEEQMSQQWWKGRGPDGNAPGAPMPSGTDMAEQHARAYADTAPFSPDGAADAATAATPAIRTLHPSRLVHNSALEEAAIRFAEGNDAEAESVLLQALAPDSAQAEHDETWRGLLDLYRATGDAEKFVAASTRYAQRMKRTGPEWVSLRALARTVQAASLAQRGRHASGDADWRSPARLSREALGDLTTALAQAGAIWRLDWRALKRIDPDAAAPLRALFAHWAASAVQLRFAGAKQLQAVLAEATPISERGTDDLWWQLRLAALRVMHLADEFELAALNYCITYEVSPPSWLDPLGGYESLDAGRESPAPAPGFSLETIGEASGAPAGSEGADAAMVALAGDLAGESLSSWQRLDAELLEASMPVVSCSALVRMDFAAAGALLNWVMERDASGQRVEFVDAHRLIAAFFGVIGIGDHAKVSARFD